MSHSKNKALFEDFAKFCENPTRDGFRKCIQNNFGELRICDFKKTWPDDSCLAKHILGIANSGGGSIFVGIEERDDGTYDPAGLETLRDKAKITNGITKYLPEYLRNEVIDTLDFGFEESEYSKLIGKKFQVVIIDYHPSHIPFLALKDGKDIRANAIYCRREGVTSEATHDEVQRMINARIETGYSSRREMNLKEHLEQLKILFQEIPRYVSGGMARKILDSFTLLGSELNPAYPKEDFLSFVARLIEQKKNRIAQDLDLIDGSSDS